MHELWCVPHHFVIHDKLPRIMKKWLLTMMIFLCGAPFAIAQRISGELHLQISDPTGATLRASGTIVGQGTGVDRTFQTDDSGKATFRALPPGHYDVTIRSSGFTDKMIGVDIH